MIGLYIRDQMQGGLFSRSIHSMEMYSSESYGFLLDRIARDLDSLISEVEGEIISNTRQKVDPDYRFDIVPILRKLKEARKEALFSTSILSLKDET